MWIAGSVVLSENGAPKIHGIHVLVIIVPIKIAYLGGIGGYALFSDTSHIGAEHKLSDAQKQFYVFFQAFLLWTVQENKSIHIIFTGLV